MFPLFSYSIVSHTYLFIFLSLSLSFSLVCNSPNNFPRKCKCFLSIVNFGCQLQPTATAMSSHLRPLAKCRAFASSRKWVTGLSDTHLPQLPVPLHTPAYVCYALLQLLLGIKEGACRWQLNDDAMANLFAVKWRPSWVLRTVNLCII